MSEIIGKGLDLIGNIIPALAGGGNCPACPTCPTCPVCQAEACPVCPEIYQHLFFGLLTIIIIGFLFKTYFKLKQKLYESKANLNKEDK